jgi:hypothetical protein
MTAARWEPYFRRCSGVDSMVMSRFPIVRPGRFVFPGGKRVPLEDVAEVQKRPSLVAHFAHRWPRHRYGPERGGHKPGGCSGHHRAIWKRLPCVMPCQTSVLYRLKVKARDLQPRGRRMAGDADRYTGRFRASEISFRSYIEPPIVMAAIPIALIGVIGDHPILGPDISMPSLREFVSLAGVAVNDSMLLVLCVTLARDEGNNIECSANQGSRQPRSRRLGPPGDSLQYDLSTIGT